MGLGTMAAGQPQQERTVAELSLPNITGPEVATILLTRKVTQTFSVAGTANGRLLARISYGIGVANDSILIDWSLGTSIMVPVTPRSKVNVTAVQIGADPNNPTDPTMGESFVLSAMIARGARSSLGAPTLSYVIPTVPQIGFVFVAVPNRAKRVIVQPPLGAASNVHAQLETALTGSPFLANLVNDSQLRTTGIVLAGNDINVLLSTNGAAAETLVKVIFLLDG